MSNKTRRADPRLAEAIVASGLHPVDAERIRRVLLSEVAAHASDDPERDADRPLLEILKILARESGARDGE